MILARIAVYGAILCTLYFNGTYAWSKGGDDLHRYGMVAVALTIDLCKAGFLPAASHLWRNTWRIPALVLFALWPLTFAYSTFAGFASITTNRTATTAVAEANAQQRARAQADYDQATAALTLAKQSAYWSASSACTAPSTIKQRAFCVNVSATKNQQEAATATLNTSTLVYVDPEVSVLRDNTGLTMPTLLLIIAAVPALILELVSSLGLYAISKRPTLKASQKPVGRFLKLRRWISRPNSETASVTAPVASGAALAKVPTMTNVTKPTKQFVDWAVP